MERCTDEKIAPQHKSAWFGFVKSIATFKGDLSNLTAPPFLLSPQSIVEYPTYWAEHPSLFIAPAHSDNPEERALLVLKWFISTLKWQHSGRDEEGNKRKMKPLNPFLGECFMGYWEDEGSGIGRTDLVAEQVSHHPPATAFNLWNETHGVRLQGSVAPRAYFSTTVHIQRSGYPLLTLSRHSESHLITMPSIRVTGLMTGSIKPELNGISHIRSSSGYTTRISYSSRGWISGVNNSFSAVILKDSDVGEGTPIYTAEGQWSSTFTARDARTGEVVLNFDANKLSTQKLKVKPIEQQREYESRRAWRHVSEAINENDMFKIGKEKAKIENEQREMRKKEKKDGKVWERRFFRKAERNETMQSLLEGLNKQGATLDMPGGEWEWDEVKYKNEMRESTSPLTKSAMKSPKKVRDLGVVLDGVEVQ